MGRCPVALAILALSGFALAQCRYPCWSEFASVKFTYFSFESEPVPPASLPYEFSFPYPPQPKGAYSEACNAQENPNVDLYSYNSEDQTWTGPLTGPVYRNPSYIQRSPLTSGWKGIAVQVSFAGKIDSSNGHTLVESTFFHNEPCYRASTEFGFSRSVQGLPGDNTIFFYYAINANCQPQGKCRVPGTQEILTSQTVHVPIQIPAEPNSQGGSDWLYEAYLIDGGAKWHIRVVDPHKHVTHGAPMDAVIEGFYQDIAKDFSANGAKGYVTSTATRDGTLEPSTNPPVMSVAKIYAAK